MAIIVSDSSNASYDGKLSTASGFYQAEAYNLGFLSTGHLAISSARTRTVTFAHSGNCQGIVLSLYNASSGSDYGVTVELQQSYNPVTISFASPAVVTSAGHGLADQAPIIFSTTNVLPAPLVVDTVYYVKTPLTDTFNISATPGGAAINTTNAGSGTHSAWGTKALTTLANTAIINSTNRYARSGNVFVPFTGGTFPSAVTTDAGKYRFRITDITGTLDHWSLNTSDGSNIFYVTWCDNKVSHSDNDVVIVKDAVTIDKSFTTSAVLGTGDTVNGVGMVICRSSDSVTPLLTWQNPPVSSYTWTIKGMICMGTRSIMRIGSTGTGRIPYAQQAILAFAYTADAGTTRPKFYSGESSVWGKASLYMYGEIPAITKYTLSADANTGQKIIYLTDVTGLNPADVLVIGKQYIKGLGETSTYAIDTIDVPNKKVTLTSNILTNARKAGGSVLKKGHYGIILTSVSTTNHAFPNPSNFEISGVELDDQSFTCGVTVTSNYTLADDVSNTSQYLIQDVLCWGTLYANYLMSLTILNYGALVQRVYGNRYCLTYNPTAYYVSTVYSGTLTIKDCVSLNMGTSTLEGGGANVKFDIENCSFENSAATYGLIFANGIDPIIKNNIFWGYSSVPGAIQLANITNTGRNILDISGNYYDYNTIGISINGALSQTQLGAYLKNESFGTSFANTTDISLVNGGYSKTTFDNCIIATTVKTLLPYFVPGSIISFINYNQSAGDDRDWLPYGYFQKTGTGLTDNTCHTSGTGKYAIRFESTSSTNLLTWYFVVPTGDITSKTMNLSVWVNINNATYYATTYQLPRLTVNYDNGTIAYSQASNVTGWQLLNLPFTPATSYGQITVTFSTMTDATGSNAYVYWDDVSISYPPNTALDLGGLDLWANALPVVPPIALPLSSGAVANQVWEELTTSHTTANTEGSKLSGLKNASLVVDGEIVL